ncbi:MAG: hypothetical protein IT557_14670 [Alphaproteobacteria bacterium]|nr:hypothetical protein [Alphaproteobacteria bacterium]
MKTVELRDGAIIAGLNVRPGRAAVTDDDGTLITVHQGTGDHLTFVYKDDKAEFSFETIEEENGEPVDFWKVELPNPRNYFFGHGPIDPSVLETAQEKIAAALANGPWEPRKKRKFVFIK